MLASQPNTPAKSPGRRMFGSGAKRHRKEVEAASQSQSQVAPRKVDLSTSDDDDGEDPFASSGPARGRGGEAPRIDRPPPASAASAASSAGPAPHK